MSKWDIVLGRRLGSAAAFFMGRGCGAGLRRRGPTRRGGRSARFFATLELRVARGTQELDVFRNDFQFVALLFCLLVLPTVQLQTTFNQNWAAFGQILPGCFGQPAKRFDIDEKNFLFLLTLIVVPHAI